MNPTQIESAITSIIIAGGGFLVGKGLVTADEVTSFATAVTTLAGALLIIVPLVRKVYTASTTAKIASINAEDNGVKVVKVNAATVNIPEATEPVPSAKPLK